MNVISHMSLLVLLYAVLEQQTLENFTRAVRAALLNVLLSVLSWHLGSWFTSGVVQCVLTQDWKSGMFTAFWIRNLCVWYSEFKDCSSETSLVSGLLVRPNKPLL